MNGKSWRLLTLIILLAVNSSVMAQKVFRLESNYERKENTYNFNGCELYINFDSTLLFIPKISPFEFVTNREIDSTIENTAKSKSIYIVVRSPKYDFTIPLSVEFFRNLTRFNIGIYAKGKQNYYVLKLPETEGGAFSSNNVRVSKNRQWKRRHFKQK